MHIPVEIEKEPYQIFVIIFSFFFLPLLHLFCLIRFHLHVGHFGLLLRIAERNQELQIGAFEVLTNLKN